MVNIHCSKKSKKVKKCLLLLTDIRSKYRTDIDIAIFHQHHIDIVSKSKTWHQNITAFCRYVNNTYQLIPAFPLDCRFTSYSRTPARFYAFNECLYASLLSFKCSVHRAAVGCVISVTGFTFSYSYYQLQLAQWNLVIVTVIVNENLICLNF